MEEDIHVMPVNDLYEHITSSKCSCRPKYAHDHLLIHNSWDRRELFEVSFWELSLKQKLERITIVLKRKLLSL